MKSSSCSHQQPKAVIASDLCLIIRGGAGKPPLVLLHLGRDLWCMQTSHCISHSSNKHHASFLVNTLAGKQSTGPLGEFASGFNGGCHLAE